MLLAVAEGLAAQFFRPSTLQRLADVATVHHVASPADLNQGVDPELLARTEVIISGWGSQLVDCDLLKQMPQLKAVVHTGGSVRKIVTLEALQEGLLVSTQANANAEPVADYTYAMVLLSLRGVFRAAQDYYEQRKLIDIYQAYPPNHVGRKVVGVVGASRIGRGVIDRLHGLDVRVLLYDPYCDDAAALGVELVSLEELFAASDVVTLHAPATTETNGMVTAELLARMRDNATLINTARGSVVDEAALVKELATGRIRGVLDVTQPPGLAPDSVLWELPNVILTPHVAGAFGDELGHLGDGAVDEVLRLLRGESMQHVVSPEEFLRSA